LIVSWIIVCQVTRLLPPPLGDLDHRSDMAVVQLAGELQAPINEQADALAEKFFGSDGRPKLAGALRFVTDFVDEALHPIRRYLEGYGVGPGLMAEAM
jgi:hypothetical protein